MQRLQSRLSGRYIFKFSTVCRRLQGVPTPTSLTLKLISVNAGENFPNDALSYRRRVGREPPGPAPSALDMPD